VQWSEGGRNFWIQQIPVLQGSTKTVLKNLINLKLGKIYAFLLWLSEVDTATENSSKPHQVNDLL